MKGKQTLKGFCMGLITAALVAGIAFPAGALSALQEIKVSMGGIQLFVDGKLQVPTDVKGNAVEPFIYNGTTYLPVRAVVGMLTDKAVEWDSKTESVYIGQKPRPGEVVRLDTLKMFSGVNSRMWVGEDAQYSILGDVQTPFNKWGYYVAQSGTYSSQCGVTYKLDSDYTTLHGQFVIPYDDLGCKDADTLYIYSVDRYGTEQMLDSYKATAGDDPIDVSVNVRGCDFIKISRNRYGIFINSTLTTATAG